MDNSTSPNVLSRVQFAINRKAKAEHWQREGGDHDITIPAAEFDALAEALAPRDAFYAVPVGRSGTLLFCGCLVTRGG